MTTVEAFAPAKINLTLHVTGQRADGYHLLDSLVVFADVGDRLWLTPGDVMQLDVTGPFADGVPVDGRNLVWKAAEAAGWRGAIRLEKNLPHGAGIGGGSADAAAVLRAVERPDLAAGLGADVPVCLRSCPQRMQGIGESLTELRDVPALSLVLVNPGVALETASVFAALEQKDHAPMAEMPDRDFPHWLRDQRNDLEAPAIRIAPEIGEVLASLSDARLARMTGSGSTCFGVYDSAAEAEAAAERLSHAHPEWWVRATRTL